MKKFTRADATDWKTSTYRKQDGVGDSNWQSKMTSAKKWNDFDEIPSKSRDKLYPVISPTCSTPSSLEFGPPEASKSLRREVLEKRGRETYTKTTEWFSESFVGLFPKTKITDPSDSVTYPALIKFLQERIRSHNEIYALLKQQEKEFYEKLQNLVRSTYWLRKENERFHSILHHKDTVVSDLERRIQEQLRLQRSLVTSSTLSEHDKLILMKQLDDREKTFNLEENNRKIHKTRLKNQLKKSSQDRGRTWEQRLKETREALDARMEEREERLRRVKRMFSQEDERSSPIKPSAPVESSASASSTLSKDVRATTRNYSRTRQASPQIPPQTSFTNIPFHNPRYRRRSKSYDVVLEHRPKYHTPLGTRLRLGYGAAETRKSVTSLKMSHALKSQRYVLEHQKADSQGNIETKIFKGDFIPTSGGGRSMIFNDVEVLHQEDPVVLLEKETIKPLTTSSGKGKTVMIREVVEEKYRKNF